VATERNSSERASAEGMTTERKTAGREAEPGARGVRWSESAFEALFRQYYTRVVAVLFRVLGNRAQAEELADDVFWKIYRQPLPADREHNLGGWLYRVATRLGIDALRAASRRRQYEQAAGQQAYQTRAWLDPLAEVLRAEQRRRVRDALSRLKPAQAQLLLLRHSGLSYQELAQALGVKASSIGTLLARAEAEFEKHYRDLAADEEEV
jgi:RNA polymerase sigma-70 factor (ECF subfamily)